MIDPVIIINNALNAGVVNVQHIQNTNAITSKDVINLTLSVMINTTPYIFYKIILVIKI